MSTVIEAIKKRSSTRGYTSQPLTEEELSTLIEAGLHFTVLKDGHPLLQELEEEKNRLREIVNPPHNFYYEAPTVVIISAERSFKWSSVDAGIAVENMALAAQGLGLGNVIIGCIDDALKGEKQDYFSKVLDFPEGYEYKIAIAFGHKAADKEPHTYDAGVQVTFL